MHTGYSIPMPVRKHDAVILSVWFRIFVVNKAIADVSLNMMAKFRFLGHQARACGQPPTRIEEELKVLDKSATGRASRETVASENDQNMSKKINFEILKLTCE